MRRKIFLSTASKEFRTVRGLLAHHLGAVRGEPFEIAVQEDFQQGGHTLLDKLADYLRECDTIIHLVGDAAGSSPGGEHRATFFAHLGAPVPPAPHDHSYTQWEYHLARRFGKTCLVYVADPATPRDCLLPVDQPDADRVLQQRHKDHILTSGEHYKTFASPLGLVREVFYDLGVNPETIKVNNLPYKTLGTLFKGRAEFLAQLRETLGDMRHTGHARAAAITSAASAATVHGLGGIGKTRAAIEYAHAERDRYTALLFVRADSAASLESNLAALCGANVLDLAEKDAREQEIQLGAVLDWLQRHPGWFLILDNVDSEESAEAVENMLSKLAASGHVLITSRLADWSGSVKTLGLDVLTEEDSTSFLMDRTHERREHQADDAEKGRLLAITLGQLPLALEQAAAYIAKHTTSFASYLSLWTTEHGHVLEWFQRRLMQYPESVATTWLVTFRALSTPARTLLNHLAWLSPAPIPDFLLEHPMPVLHRTFWQRVKGWFLKDPFIWPENPRDALAELEIYSFAKHRADPEFTIHALVQDVTRYHQRDEKEHATLHRTLGWVNDAIPHEASDVRSWPVLEPLAPHAEAIATFADQHHIPDPTSRLMNQLAIYFETKADYQRAEPLMRRALAIDEQSYGKDHPNVATDLNNLAQLLQTTNRLAEAEPSRSCAALWRSMSKVTARTIPKSQPTSTASPHCCKPPNALRRPSRSCAALSPSMSKVTARTIPKSRSASTISRNC